MLLRICLILAILAGVGVIVVSQVKVKPHIQSIIDEREKNAKDRDMEKGAKVKALAELKKKGEELTQTQKKLGETETQLAAASARAAEQEKRGNELQQNWDKTKQELTGTQQKLSRWTLIGLEPEQIKSVVDSEKNLRAENAALDQEKKIIFKQWQRDKAELVRYKQGDDTGEAALPAGLKGQVVAVDPKWNFVILNIGETNGVLQNGVMMVSRQSKLVGKVRIMSVQPGRSIANIIPSWKMAEVMEGDLVLSLY
jgi:hypothetical protein